MTRKTAAYFLALPPVLAAAFSFILPYTASFIPAIRGLADGEISVLQNSALLKIILFTFKQAFFSVLVSLALGLPGAWFMGNSRSRFTPFLRTLTAIPFAMPSILVVLGFVLFFGNSGWINRIYSALPFSGAEPIRILYKPLAVILAHGFFNFPLVVRLAGDGIARARRVYAPIAASLGASPLKIILTVILPLTVPSIMAASFLVFMYCFTSFAVVLVLGGGPNTTTLAVEIYRHARIFLNYGNAGFLALIETLIAVCIFLTYVFIGKKSMSVQTNIIERADTEKKSPVSRIIMIIYLIIIAFFVIGPLISIPLESFLYRPSRTVAQVLSVRWWSNLGDTCLPALGRSLILAFFSATTACVLALFAASAVKLYETNNSTASFPANLIRFFAASPVISSGIILGLGWLILYGRNFPRSPTALVLLHGVSAMPFTFNFISEGFRSLPANTLNAATVFGANPLCGLLTTALPLSLPRIRSAWGFSAALSLGELNAVMMLGMEDWETLPLYIYRAVSAYRYGTACAAGTLLILCCAACFLISETGRKKYA
ncbi:MAG: iron ABC transporter permease [Treponema sp.]|jgi:thiamine transport system permease protein|nr:iron ABC transporter permease [Treponema sp.]